MQLAEEIGPWRECCQELAVLFKPARGVNLLGVLKVLKSATDLTVVDGCSNYTHIRLVRALAVMLSQDFTDPQWNVCCGGMWLRMSR